MNGDEEEEGRMNKKKVKERRMKSLADRRRKGNNDITYCGVRIWN